MSEIQHKAIRSSFQVCDVSGHPDTGKMNWAEFNKGIDRYLRKKGLVTTDPLRLRGIAARSKKGAENREISLKNQGKIKGKKQKKS